MSKQTEPFRIQNSDWTITETAPDIFELASHGGTKKKIGGLTGKRLVSALAVISELDRHLREVSQK
jgi:hypothetical protein